MPPDVVDAPQIDQPVEILVQAPAPVPAAELDDEIPF
jgi:hypothetical protein